MAAMYFRVNSTFQGELTVVELITIGFAWGMLCFMLWFLSYRTNIVLPLYLVLLVALLIRVLAIGAEPILEDDGYRFLWDGRQTIVQGSPYISAPAVHFEDESLLDTWHEILENINHPEITTVYGPTAQVFFALAHLIAPAEWWGLQSLFILIDLLLIALLCLKTNSRNLMLYAWSPLIVKEFAFSVHPDAVGAFLLLMAWYLQQKKRLFLAGIFMALAAGIKVFALLAIPLILHRCREAWVGFIATLVAVALPFGFIDAWVPEGLVAMGSEWTFNAPVYLSAIDYYSVSSIKLLMGVIFVLGMSWLFWKPFFRYSLEQVNRETPHLLQLAFGLLLLCSPVVNPWYLVWILVFAAIRPTLWAWTASVVVLLAYVSGINWQGRGAELYQQPLWLVWFEFGLVITALWCQPKLKKAFGSNSSKAKKQ